MLAVAIALPLGSKPGTRGRVWGLAVLKVTDPAGAVPLLGVIVDCTTAVIGMPAVELYTCVSGAFRVVMVEAGVTVARQGPVWHDEELASPWDVRVMEWDPCACR